ncbi:MAG: ribosome silencing factor [Geminicoccaceae bacterium]
MPPNRDRALTSTQEPAANDSILPLVLSSLDDDKALEPVVIDLAGKTTLADHMVVATGTSQRHLASMAEKLIQRLKAAGREGIRAEGLGATARVLIDAGEVIVHLFRAETRTFYDIERLWQVVPRERLKATASAAEPN